MVLFQWCNPKQRDRYASDGLYGVINGVMLIPIMISFCSIIFRNQSFAPIMPQLVKLVLTSGMVHQISFTIFSSLPFAIGQVQDAGLIFLSGMAGALVELCSSDGLIATTLVTLSLSTAMLGVMLIIIGKLELAVIVQFLPMPVIGGYLAFIGFFCLEAALAMMGGVDVGGIEDWGKFVSPVDRLILLMPGLALGLGMYGLVRVFKSPYVLPISMAAILAGFYVVSWITGVSIQESRDKGWVTPLVPEAPFYTMWDLFDISKVEWQYIPTQSFRWVGMMLVVAFSSSLDVAAIEMELGLALDYNRELKTVGIANLASGLCGGFTGSYIFSQTIFCMRRGVSTKLCGVIVALSELIIIVLPIPITCYIPKMFFGSILIMISIDLMIEWLISARKKMMLSEYLVCLFTFAAIQYQGVEIGMCIGIVSSMITFVIAYASKVPPVSVTTIQQSTVKRTFAERARLMANRHLIVTISMSGYIFFGSAVSILNQVKKNIHVSNSSSVARASEPSSHQLSDYESATDMVGDTTFSTNCQSDSIQDVSSSTIGNRPLFSNGSPCNQVPESQLINASTRYEYGSVGNATMNTEGNTSPHTAFPSTSVFGLDTDNEKDLPPASYGAWLARLSYTGDSKSYANDNVVNPPAFGSPVRSIAPLIPVSLQSQISSRTNDDARKNIATEQANHPPGWTGWLFHTLGFRFKPSEFETRLATPHTPSQLSSASSLEDCTETHFLLPDHSTSKKFARANSMPAKPNSSPRASMKLVTGTDNSLHDETSFNLAGRTVYELSGDEIVRYQGQWSKASQLGLSESASMSTGASLRRLKAVAPNLVSTSSIVNNPVATAVIRDEGSSASDAAGLAPLVYATPSKRLGQTVSVTTRERIGTQIITEYDDVRDTQVTKPGAAGLESSHSPCPPVDLVVPTSGKSDTSGSPPNTSANALVPLQLHGSSSMLDALWGHQDARDVTQLTNPWLLVKKTNSSSSLDSTGRNESIQVVGNRQRSQSSLIENKSARESTSSRLLHPRSSSFDRPSSPEKPRLSPTQAGSKSNALLSRTNSLKGVEMPAATTSPLMSAGKHRQTMVRGQFPVTACTNSESDLQNQPQSISIEFPDEGDSSSEVESDVESGTAAEYIILDFSRVIGVDATAARSCFLMLVQLLRASGVRLLFAELEPPVQKLLRSHRVLRDDDIVIPKLDDALEWCEEEILRRIQEQMVQAQSDQNPSIKDAGKYKHAGFNRDPSYYANAWLRRHQPVVAQRSVHNIGVSDDFILSRADSISSVQSTDTNGTAPRRLAVPHAQTRSRRALRRLLEDHLEVENGPNNPVHKLLSSAVLNTFFDTLVLAPGDMLYDIGQKADFVYFVEDGEIEIMNSNLCSMQDDFNSDISEFGKQTGISSQRLNKISSGCACGEAEFFLRKRYSVQAFAVTATSLSCLSREKYSIMEVQHPQLCILLQHIMLKGLSMTQLTTQMTISS